LAEKKADRENAGVGAAPTPATDRAPQRAVQWEDAVRGAEIALRNAWRVNVVNLSFRTVTGITLGAILAICLLFALVQPHADRRTRQTDALEFAVVTLLTVMFSPLSFNYAYVWLIYPTTLVLSLVMSEPASAPRHRLKVAWIAAVFFIPALAVPLPLAAQAYGNLFVPALLLVIGLCAMLRSAGGPGRIRRVAAPAHLVPRRQIGISSVDPFIVPS
jgi:hypothetical protein